MVPYTSGGSLASLSCLIANTILLNRDGTQKHDYPANERRFVTLGHWNWKRNPAQSNYSTYNEEPLALMLLLSEQEVVKTFQNVAPPENAKVKRWWTHLSQFKLTVHPIPGKENPLADWISHTNFDALLGESSELSAKEAFKRMDVQLARPLLVELDLCRSGWYTPWLLSLPLHCLGILPAAPCGHLARWPNPNQTLPATKGSKHPKHYPRPP